MDCHATGTLAVFALVVLLDALGLALDAWLSLSGRPTISDEVWRAPVLGVPILALQVAGTVALAGHFYPRVPPWYAGAPARSPPEELPVSVTLSDDQVQQLQDKVAGVISSRSAAATASAAKASSDQKLAADQSENASLAAAEAQAHGQLDSSLADLRAFVDGLAPPG